MPKVYTPEETRELTFKEAWFWRSHGKVFEDVGNMRDYNHCSSSASAVLNFYSKWSHKTFSQVLGEFMDWEARIQSMGRDEREAYLRREPSL